MKKHLVVHHMKDHSPEWYAFRDNGLGGSEAAYAIGLGNPKYGSAAITFHEKIGTHPPSKEDNQRMFWGRMNEDKIAEVWQYYDNTLDGYLENFKNQQIVRSCRNINGYITNPNYPWLFASVARLMTIKGGINFLTGEPLDTEAVLECKNVGQFASLAWQDGVPMYFLVQVHIYMIIMETDYAELAMLIDGGTLQVEKIQRDDELCERIISKTKEFWYDKVVPGKEAKAKRDLADAQGKLQESEKWDAVIQQVEPDPDNTEAYTQFMNEKYVNERESVTGNMSLYNLAKADRFYKKLINRLDEQRTLLKNIFVKFLSDKGAETVDFGTLGRVNWSIRKGSKSRTFNNRTKEIPDEEQVEIEFEKLDPECF